MCDQATTKICDELQTIAIETTVDPSYGEWRNQLESALRNKPAILHRSEHVLKNAWKDGLTPSFVAERLDKTWEALKPTLFRAKELA
jgi:hypothetical protein